MKPLISHPGDLTPETEWLDTQWAWTPEEDMIDHRTKGRLCAAALLPFHAGKPDWDGFSKSIRWMQAAADHFRVELVTVLKG